MYLEILYLAEAATGKGFPYQPRKLREMHYLPDDTCWLSGPSQAQGPH